MSTRHSNFKTHRQKNAYKNLHHPTTHQSTRRRKSSLIPKTFYVPNTKQSNDPFIITANHISHIFADFPFHQLSRTQYTFPFSTSSTNITTHSTQDSPKFAQTLNIAIAVSGGADSLTAAIILHQWAEKHNSLTAQYHSTIQHTSDPALQQSHPYLNSHHNFLPHPHLIENNIKIEICGITVNHGLRVEADDEVIFVKKFLSQFNIPCDIININLKSSDHQLGYEVLRDSQETTKSDFTSQTFQYGNNLAVLDKSPQSQSKARIWRYNAMIDHCVRHNLVGIVTGHHLDDQRETVLMRLCRGSGLSGLQAMDPILPIFFFPISSTDTTSSPQSLVAFPITPGTVSPFHQNIPILRPLLSFPRHTIESTFIHFTHTLFPKNPTGIDCDNSHNGWVEDPSNHSDIYDRVKIRKFLMQHFPSKTHHFLPHNSFDSRTPYLFTTDTLTENDWRRVETTLNSQNHSTSKTVQTEYESPFGLDYIHALSIHSNLIVQQMIRKHVVMNQTLRMCTISFPLSTPSLAVSPPRSSNFDTSPAEILKQLVSLPITAIDTILSYCITTIVNDPNQPKRVHIQQLRDQLITQHTPLFEKFLQSDHGTLQFPPNTVKGTTLPMGNQLHPVTLQDCRIWSELALKSSSHSSNTTEQPVDYIPTHFVIHMAYGFPTPPQLNQKQKKNLPPHANPYNTTFSVFIPPSPGILDRSIYSGAFSPDQDSVVRLSAMAIPSHSTPFQQCIVKRVPFKTTRNTVIDELKEIASKNLDEFVSTESQGKYNNDNSDNNNLNIFQALSSEPFIKEMVSPPRKSLSDCDSVDNFKSILDDVVHMHGQRARREGRRISFLQPNLPSYELLQPVCHSIVNQFILNDFSPSKANRWSW